MAFFKRKRKEQFEGGGLVLFLDVKDAINAEKVLNKAGYIVKLVAPPPELRKGCDLAVEINLVEQPGIERELEKQDVAYVNIAPLKVGTSELLTIVQSADFDDWIMIKAGNMKLTFDKSSGLIVNVSGGGCPDIPHMHAELIDRPLLEAPQPKEIGFTLCSLMLQRALEESVTVWQEDEQL